MSTGRIVYTPPKKHKCEPPKKATKGQVYECGCGRLHRCIDRVTDHGKSVTMVAHWVAMSWLETWWFKSTRPVDNAQDGGES